MNKKLIEICQKAQKASYSLSSTSGETRNLALSFMAESLVENCDYILNENAKDISNAKINGVKESMIDRLMLSKERIAAIANSIRKVIALPDPLGNGVAYTRPNGLNIKKIHVPIGTIGIIYEARPNVTADAASLCIKSGNSVVLKGGKDAVNSNIAIGEVLREAIEKAGIDKNSINVIEDTDRETTISLMQMKGYIDVLIPRGSKGLIKSVTENATVPVIETGAGNCHIYVEKSAEIEKAINIIKNAKCSRPSVCNAVETVLIHQEMANAILPLLKESLNGVEIRGCEITRSIIDCIPATEEDWETEYNDYILAIKVVSSSCEAIDHINRFNTNHSEAIITSSLDEADQFQSKVQAAAVYVNASTRFTDGEEFGLGAEIGISTQKLHARGPMGLEELTTTKYLIIGNGQIR